MEMCVGSRLDGMFSEVTEDGRERAQREPREGRRPVRRRYAKARDENPQTRLAHASPAVYLSCLPGSPTIPIMKCEESS